MIRPDRELVERLSSADAPRGQWLLEGVASLRESVRMRRPARVAYRDGNWIHRVGGTVLVTRDFWTYSPQGIEDVVEDHVCFRFRPRPGDVVMDVGAGVGEVARVLARMIGPAGRLVAVEAHPATRGALELMLRLNGLENVEVVGAAAMAEPGTVEISDGDRWESNSLVAETDAATVPVRAVTLDAVADERGLDTIDLLTMNIEGAEVGALQGMGRTLPRCRHVVIMCHDFLADEGGDGLRTMEPVRELLEDHGFETTTRPGHPQPAVRCTLYGRNPRFDA